MSEWVRVGEAAQFAIGRGRAVVVDGAAIAVFRTRKRWIALDDRCPHMGASLAAGRLIGGQVQCSWHEWRYDVSTGRCPVRPWACVRVHDIKEEGGTVFIRRPTPAPPPTSRGDEEPEWVRRHPAEFFKKKETES